MIRVAFVEDNQTYREALQAYLENLKDIQLVHLATNLQTIKDLVLAKPDVVIMDIDLGEDSGITGVSTIKKLLPGTSVFMLTVFDDEDKIVRSIQAGAVGYLLKKDPPQKIVAAIRSVFKGEGFINGQVAKTLVNAFPKPAAPADLSAYQLTRREKEMMDLLLEGYSYKEIADRSFISMSTLNTHIRNLYDKLGLHSRAEISARFHK